MATNPQLAPKKKVKYVPFDLGPPQPKPSFQWGQQTVVVPTTPVVTPTKYIGPPLTNGPIAGTKLHLQNWIEAQVNKLSSWCDAIQGGSFKENQGPSYPHVVSLETYNAVWTWWELKGSITGPNAKKYSCSGTEPSGKEGRTLQVGASQQGNILATTNNAPYQTRLNLHVDIT